MQRERLRSSRLELYGWTVTILSILHILHKKFVISGQQKKWMPIWLFSDQHPLLFTYLSHWTIPRFLHIMKYLLMFLVVRTSCSWTFTGIFYSLIRFPLWNEFYFSHNFLVIMIISSFFSHHLRFAPVYKTSFELFSCERYYLSFSFNCSISFICWVYVITSLLLCQYIFSYFIQH